MSSIEDVLANIVIARLRISFRVGKCWIVLGVIYLRVGSTDLAILAMRCYNDPTWRSDHQGVAQGVAIKS
jgi:hypothetical protein